MLKIVVSAVLMSSVIFCAHENDEEKARRIARHKQYQASMDVLEMVCPTLASTSPLPNQALEALRIKNLQSAINLLTTYVEENKHNGPSLENSVFLQVAGSLQCVQTECEEEGESDGEEEDPEDIEEIYEELARRQKILDKQYNNREGW
ncbi:MAG: hypothetical protein LW696_06650 [Alphaproteobacteria bacterium]|jgi:hypothetical protein|nr:hypothetical protein [Alphaproteobacteria bacterium]